MTLTDKVKTMAHLSIPYFNADKFEKCTGINVED